MAEVRKHKRPHQCLDSDMFTESFFCRFFEHRKIYIILLDPVRVCVNCPSETMCMLALHQFETAGKGSVGRIVDGSDHGRRSGGWAAIASV